MDDFMTSSDDMTLGAIDAAIDISISDNKLDAYMSIQPAMNGGAVPTLDTFLSELAKCKICYGINMHKLEEIADNLIYNSKIIIAKGIAPINGINGTAAFQFKVGKDYKPKERDDGKVDFHDLCIVENVNVNDVLCIITHPTKGVEGMTVRGEKIVQIKGKAIPALLGKNTQLSEDGNSIFATISGQVEYDSKKISVRETYFVSENVDNTTGDIKVLGNVVINGVILPGFVVEAGGNIEVNGTIASATLKAGGNIILRSGITGSSLNCKGDLTSRFIENCNVFVNGAVKSEYIMSSQIKCGKSLQIIGVIGKFVGGSCVVGQDMIARVIGSGSGVKTEVQLGTDSSIIERHQELVKQIPELEKQISSLTSIISLLQQLEAANRLSNEKKAVLSDALYSYEANTELIESQRQELAEIVEAVQQRGYGRIICKGTIHPGSIISIGTAKLIVTNAIMGTTLCNSEGVVCKDLSL